MSNLLDPIPRPTALALCAEIRRLYLGKWYTFAGWQCWGCTTFSHGDADKMCFASRADGRGCGLVNARHDRRMSKST